MKGYTPPKKSRRIRLVENTVERTARMLSHAYGIRVVWKGSQAMTDGKTITLPVLPDDAPVELLEAVQGYLDHETAHIIFSDFPALTNHKPKLTEEEHFCVNTVEDVRIEAAMGNLFPGSPYNLRKCHTWVGARLKKHWPDINQFKRACAAYFYYAKFGKTDDWYTSTVDAETHELVLKCDKAVGPYDRINTTQAAIKAGLRMYEVLKEPAAKEKEEREEREKQQKAKGMAGPGAGQQKDKNGDPIITSVGELNVALSKEAKQLIDEAIATGKWHTGHYNYQHGQEEGGYIAYSTAGDTIQPMPDGDLQRNGQNLMRLRDEAVAMTGVIKSRLVNSLRAMARRRWLGGKEEGKIDTRHLYRAVIGTSNNVYKQLTDKMQLNTVVGLAIDHSGSMNEDYKLELAGKAAIVIGDALNVLRVPFMVYGYSTEAPLETPKDTTAYARWGRLWIRYYRDFNESWEKGALRLAGSKHNCQANTLDAESVQHGIRRLLQRPEKRKILLVLNDGMPYPGYGHVGRCQQHLHDVVLSAKAVGVEVVAFGIGDDDVKQYYPNHVVIRKLGDLVAEPLILLDKMLRGGMTLK